MPENNSNIVNLKEALEKSLSLKENGGIYYEGTRVTGNPGNLWLLVGVGGFGTGTLIRLKHEIMNRMNLPKDASGAPTGEPPKNIAFLAIDTQDGDIEKQCFADTKFSTGEILYTHPVNSNWQNVIRGMYSDKKEGLTYADFLPGTSMEDLDSLASGSAAGVMRLLGRVGLFCNDQNVINRLNNVISKVKAGAGTLRVCLFAGIGGGTGSGSFIDIAFLLKKLTLNAELYSYLYLPDLQIKDGSGQSGRERNAFAALKELDQIIELGANGQNKDYKFGKNGGVISHKYNPFNYCYLINGTDSNNVTHEKENVVADVAEAVFEVIADQTRTGNGGTTSGIVAIDANATNWFNTVSQNSSYPATYRYMSICSNSRKIPYLEINTLVMGAMFKKLRDNVFNIPVTRESMNEDIKALGLNTILINEQKDEITSIEEDFLTQLNDRTPAECDLSVYRKGGLFGLGEGSGMYRIEDVWAAEIHDYTRTNPYKAAKDALGDYQSAINANLGTMIGITVENNQPTLCTTIGKLEEKLRTFIVDKISDKSRGPFYVKKLVGGPYASNLISLFKQIKDRSDRLVSEYSTKASLAIENKSENSGCKIVFQEVKGKRRIRTEDLEEFLNCVGEWQSCMRTASIYSYMSKLCSALIDVYQKYYDTFLVPMTNTIKALEDIFEDNDRFIRDKAQEYTVKPDPQMLLYPLDFVDKFETQFKDCVNEAYDAFLGYMKEHMEQLIGIKINTKSKNSDENKYTGINDQKIKVPGLLSDFISKFLANFYRTVSIESIYESKFGATFDDDMKQEIENLYRNANPLFSLNPQIPTTDTVQNYAVLYVPNNSTGVLTVANNLAATPHYRGKIQPILTGDVSRLSMVKVGSGYSLINNIYIGTWEKCYDDIADAQTHLSDEWAKEFPSPNVQSAWVLTGDKNDKTIARDKKYSDMFRFCCKHGIIKLSDKRNEELTAILYPSVETFHGKPVGEYLRSYELPDGSLTRKENDIEGLFNNIWKMTEKDSIKLNGMGKYKGGKNADDSKRMNNIMTNVLRNSYLCSVIEKQYHLLKLYDELLMQFKTPEWYIKACLCKLIKYEKGNFRTTIYTSKERSNPRGLVEDDSVRRNRKDFHYEIYKRFDAIKDEIATGNDTWLDIIKKRWDLLIENCDKQELYDDINKKKEDYKISYDYYMEQSKEEGIGAMYEKYIEIANFYNLCMLYADKNMSGLLDENTFPEDEEDTEYEEEDI